MGTWANQTSVEQLLPPSFLADVTDDAANPGTLDATMLASAIGQAESQAKGSLRRRYPTQVDAGTASPLVTLICSQLAVAILAIRRPGMTGGLSVLKTDAESLLNDIRRGYSDVPEWELVESTTGLVQTAKIKPQADGDLFDYAVDSYLVPSEHDEDER